MTQMGLSYLMNEESIRSNKAREYENTRTNSTNEGISRGRLVEDTRHNFVGEGINQGNLDETVRNNTNFNIESIRSNKARETENTRSSKANVAEMNRSNVTDEGERKYQYDLSKLGNLTSGNLSMNRANKRGDIPNAIGEGLGRVETSLDKMIGGVVDLFGLGSKLNSVPSGNPFPSIGYQGKRYN